MLELVKCPKCGRLAVGMSEWSAEQPVRCPYCPAEFVFGRAIEQPLRELTRVTTEVEQPSGPPETPSPPPEPLLPQQEGAPPPAITVESALSAPPGSDDDLVVVHDDAATKPVEEPAGEQFLAGEAVRLPRSYADAYDFLPEQQKRQLETAGAVAARLRGDQRRQRSCLGELVKIVLGGVVGLMIGYWLLNYFGGRKYDWLQVYLPGCPHTEHHWPAEYFREKPAAPPTPGPAVPRGEPIPLRRVPKPVPLPSESSSEPTPSPRPDESVVPPPPAEPSAPSEPAPEAKSDVPPEPEEPTVESKTDGVPSLPGLDELKKSEEE